MKKGLLVLAIAVMVFMVSGCRPPFRPEPSLTIQRHSWLVEEKIEGQYWAEITGEAVNDGNVDLFYAEIWATFKDSSGQVITKEYTNQLEIEIGEIWHFQILYWHDIRPDSYELAVSGLSY